LAYYNRQGVETDDTEKKEKMGESGADGDRKKRGEDGFLRRFFLQDQPEWKMAVSVSGRAGTFSGRI
jgi:hypothetical protein